MKTADSLIMVYGANGYSARLIIEELLLRKIKPILAGRNVIAIVQLANEYKCDYKIFNLDDENVIDDSNNFCFPCVDMSQ